MTAAAGTIPGGSFYRSLKMKINRPLKEIEKAVLRHMLEHADLQDTDLDGAEAEIPEELADELREACRHPVTEGPISSFIYYRDTLEFFRNNEPLLLRWLVWDIGMWDIYTDLRSLIPSLHDFTREELRQGWYGEVEDQRTAVQNAVAMFAAQVVAVDLAGEEENDDENA